MTIIRSAAGVTRALDKCLLEVAVIVYLLVFWCGIAPALGASLPGVYALSDQDAATSLAVLANPNVDGLALRYSWNQLEPREGGFNWSPIDVQVAAARAHGKKVSLSVTAGIRTPVWVYAEGARQFSFVWDKPCGAPIWSRQHIPIPWDPVYLTKWKAFVR